MPDSGPSVDYLYETPDSGLLQVDAGGKAYRDHASQQPQGASLSGPDPYGSSKAKEPPPGGLGGSVVELPKPHHVPRAMSPEELMVMANRMEQQFKDQHNASLAQGPSARRLQSGSPESDFNTELTQGAEKAFDKWPGRVMDNGKVDAGDDYDLRGAFADNIGRSSNFHLPDTYKKPNHETFSDESVYSDYGPHGHWNGDAFTAPLSRPVPEWLNKYMSHQAPMGGGLDMAKTSQYLSEQDRLKELKAEHQRLGLR